MWLNNMFVYTPGGENDGGNYTPDSNDDDQLLSGDDSKLEEDVTEKKPFAEKVREALQDWSNDDQRDQEIDDSTP